MQYDRFGNPAEPRFTHNIESNSFYDFVALTGLIMFALLMVGSFIVGLIGLIAMLFIDGHTYMGLLSLMALPIIGALLRG